MSLLTQIAALGPVGMPPGPLMHAPPFPAKTIPNAPKTSPFPPPPTAHSRATALIPIVRQMWHMVGALSGCRLTATGDTQHPQTSIRAPAKRLPGFSPPSNFNLIQHPAHTLRIPFRTAWRTLSGRLSNRPLAIVSQHPSCPPRGVLSTCIYYPTFSSPRGTPSIKKTQ